jgi:hypothetical protein
MTPEEQARQQSSDRAQYNVNNTPLSPVQVGNATSLKVTEVTVDSSNGDTAEGPLSSLYRHNYALTNLKYPLDVGNRGVGKGHVVQFDISDIDPVTLKDVEKAAGQLYDKVSSMSPNSTVSAGIEKVGEYVNDAKNTTAGQAYAKVVDVFSNAPKINYSPSTTQTKATIQLLMPDSLQFGYQVQYDKLSVGDAAGSIVPLVGTIARAITSGAGKLALNKLGYAFNPQEQQIFEGIEFREYEMTFTFTPISEQEANIVKQIIKTFRKHAAPTVVNKLAGFFFNPPSVFDVSFFYNGQPNYNLNAIRRSVITNIEVDYAPNGWSAFRNGAPVQTTMTISFRETELVDRTSIEAER